MTGSALQRPSFAFSIYLALTFSNLRGSEARRQLLIWTDIASEARAEQKT